MHNDHLIILLGVLFVANMIYIYIIAMSGNTDKYKITVEGFVFLTVFAVIANIFFIAGEVIISTIVGLIANYLILVFGEYSAPNVIWTYVLYNNIFSLNLCVYLISVYIYHRKDKKLVVR